MRIAIVYYTLEGHTRRAAEYAARELDANLIELVCTRPYPDHGPAKFGRATKDTLAGVCPELEPYTFDASTYDLVVLASPCWCAKAATPFNTFLRDHDISAKRRAVLLTCKAAGSTAKFAEDMRRSVNVPVGSPVVGLSERQCDNPALRSEALAAFLDACRQEG